VLCRTKISAVRLTSKYFELHSVTSQLLAIYNWLAVEQELESRIYNPNYIAVS